MVADVLAQFLQAAGHTVEIKHDGLDAWERIMSDPQRFDVLITDHQMPGLNGLELAELLRQVNYAGRIVVHSGSVAPEEAVRYRALGVAAIVPKAASLADLLAAVEAPPVADGS